MIKFMLILMYRNYYSTTVMNIRKKTPSELEHQVADYLLHGDGHPEMMSARYLGKMTSLLLETGIGNAIDDDRLLTHNRLASPNDIAEFIEKYPEHLNSRSKDTLERVFYKQKAAAVERYNQEFAHIVDAIDTQAETGLLEGSYATPYMIKKDGQDYIVRVLKSAEGMNQVEKHIDAALRVQDIPHLEHIVAVSYKDGITIAPLLPGKGFKFLALTGGAEHVSQEQLRELYDAMKQANERGVGFDGIGGNIFYDSEQGFSALDLEPLKPWTTASSALRKQLEYLILDASSGTDLVFMQQIERIVVDAEVILSEDEAAKKDLLQLQGMRRKELLERIDQIKEFDELEDSWRYDDDYPD